MNSMKSMIKILIVALLLLSGCTVTKKATEQTVAKTAEQTEKVSTVKEIKDLKENKDIKTEMETVTEETVTEFYEPAKVNATIIQTTKGPIKAIKTIKTTTKKKDVDNSITTGALKKQEDSKLKFDKQEELRKVNVEVKKTGVAAWKIVAFVVALLVTLFLLIKYNTIKIPFQGKVIKMISVFLGLNRDKAE